MRFDTDVMREMARQRLKDWWSGRKRDYAKMMRRADTARFLKPKKVKHAIRK